MSGVQHHADGILHVINHHALDAAIVLEHVQTGGFLACLPDVGVNENSLACRRQIHMLEHLYFVTAVFNSGQSHQCRARWGIP